MATYDVAMAKAPSSFCARPCVAGVGRNLCAPSTKAEYSPFKMAFLWYFLDLWLDDAGSIHLAWFWRSNGRWFAIGYRAALSLIDCRF